MSRSAGSVFKRCGCTVVVDGKRKQLGARCPKLRRGDGTWNPRHGTWAFAISVTGKGGRRQQIVRSGFPTQVEAQTAMDAARGKVASGGTITSARLTVGEYLAKWLQTRTDLRLSTRRAYESHIRLYWTELIGHVRLVDLRREHVAAALAEVPGSDANRQRVRATLRAALSDAEAEGLVVRNAAKLKMPAGKRPRALVWTAERVAAWQNAVDQAAKVETAEAGQILQAAMPSPVMVWTPAQLGAFLDHAATDRLFPLFLLIAHRGPRRGEACGLKWEDVDLDAGTATIRRQLVQDGWKVIEGPPKSTAGERTIALDRATVAAFKTHRAAQIAERLEWGPAYVDTGYCFTRENGEPLHPATVTIRFHELASAAGLPPVRLHDLRHGAASVMLAAGVQMKTVQETLGHSSIGLTADTYTSVYPTVAAEAAEAAAALIPRAVNGADADTGAVIPLSHSESERTGAKATGAKTQLYKGFRRGAPGARTRNLRIKSP